MQKWIGMFIIGIVVIIVVGSAPTACGYVDNGSAPEAAADYAAKMGWRVVDVAHTDTDGDGYVSATFMDGNGHAVGGQCGTGYGFACGTFSAGGCKLDTAHGYRDRSGTY